MRSTGRTGRTPDGTAGLRLAAVLALAAGLGACARAPESVQPVVVSPLKYQGMGCNALTAEVLGLDERLAQLYTRQRTNQVFDHYTLLYFLHARATVIGPDLVPTIALAKGERDAANAVLQSRC